MKQTDEIHFFDDDHMYMLSVEEVITILDDKDQPQIALKLHKTSVDNELVLTRDQLDYIVATIMDRML